MKKLPEHFKGKIFLRTFSHRARQKLNQLGIGVKEYASFRTGHFTVVDEKHLSLVENIPGVRKVGPPKDVETITESWKSHS